MVALHIIQWVVALVALIDFYYYTVWKVSYKSDWKSVRITYKIFSLAFIVLSIIILFNNAVALVIGEIFLFIGIGWSIIIYVDWYDYNLHVNQFNEPNLLFLVPLIIGVLLFMAGLMIHLHNLYGNIN